VRNYLGVRKSKVLMQYGIHCRAEALIRHFAQLDCSVSHTILDIGTADGLVFCKLAKHYGFRLCIGIDIRLDYLRAACANVPYVVQADGKRLPFPDRSIDAIICTAVFKHIRGLERLLEECGRVLNQEGKLVAMDPTPLGIRLGLLLRHFSQRTIVQILSLRDTEQLLEQYGFTTISKERFMLTPVPFIGCEVLERVLKKLNFEFLFLNQVVCVGRGLDALPRTK